MIIAAFDFGTTGCKAAFYQENGSTDATVYHEYPTYFPQKGWVEQDPWQWRSVFIRSTEELLEKTGISPNQIACIALSGHMMGCVPVDTEGTPLTNRVMLWADTRCEAQAQLLIRKLGWERFYRDTGGGLDIILYPAAKIPWIKENQPEIYQKAAKFLGTKDTIAAWLTGNLATDFSEASDTGFFHLEKKCWHEDFLRELEIDRGKMPDLLPSTKIVGTLTTEAARDTGLVSGIPVVIGGGDVVCGAVGAGAIAEGCSCMNIGSAGWISVVSRDPIIDLRTRPMTICHVVPGLYTSQIIMYSAGVAYKWARDAIYLQDGDSRTNIGEGQIFDAMDKLAESAPPGSKGLLFLPYLRGGGAPYYDVNARGSFLGLHLAVRKAEILRSVLEGVAFNMRLMMNSLERKLSINDIIIYGGGSRSTLWKKIFANILNKNIVTLSAQQEVNTIGAALIGGVGLGIFSDFSEVSRFVTIKEIESPDTDLSRLYDELFMVFEHAYEDVAGIFKNLGETRASSL
ncbi:MAG: FGGY-family carbohydrate kinase [Candidatus Methanomethyliaceae archaeon]